MKDSYYFKHDSNARNDPKMKALINKYGMEGYGRFWVIIEHLREASNYKLSDKSYIWSALAEEMHCKIEQVQEFVNFCAEIELIEREDSFFYSSSLLERMQKLDELRNKRKLAAHKGWDNR